MGLHPLKTGGVPEQSEGEGGSRPTALIDAILVRYLRKPCCFTNPLRRHLFGDGTSPVPLRYTREDPPLFIHLMFLSDNPHNARSRIPAAVAASSSLAVNAVGVPYSASAAFSTQA